MSDGLKCNAGTVIREQAGIDCFTGTYTGKTVLGGETCTLDITDKRMLKYTAGGKSWTINSPGKTIATVSQGELVNGQPPVKVGVLGVTSSDNKLAIGLRINTKAERWVNYFEGALINVGIVGNKDGHPPVCVIGKPNPTPTPKMEGVGRAWTIAAKYSDLLRGGPDAKPGAEINYGYSLGLYYGDAFRYPDAAEAGARYFSKLNSGVFTGKTSTGRACKVTINPADLSFKLEEGSFSYSSTGLVSATDYKKDYGFISADGSAGNILVGYVNSILELRDAQSAKLSFTHLPLINNSKPDEYSGTSFTYEKGTEKSTCYLE
ncbi:MAG: hypothetical protein Q4G39_02240 [Brachymonas sp.]|nr:hypothetical protein [Brachymonas sp.]